MTYQAHFSHNVRPYRSSAVGQLRTAKSGVKFLRNRTAAHDGTAFENQWLEPSLGEIERRNQSVVPAAENDDIPRCRHG